MGMTIQEFQDLKALAGMVAGPLDHIAGSLAEIQQNLEAIVSEGATVTISIKIGGDPSV